MGKYEQDARLLLEYVGGKENIAAVSHCVSRMRFVLNDPAKADVAKIESLKSAKGTFTQAGQFQVIMQVSPALSALCSVLFSVLFMRRLLLPVCIICLTQLTCS